MLKFEAFNLPTDGLTRIHQVDSYSAPSINEGWTMVGLAECSQRDTDTETVKLFGVYRLTETDALRKALTDTETAQKEAKTHKEKVGDLERQLKDMTTRNAALAEKVEFGESSGRLVARARERFGQAFVDLEKER